MGRVGSQKPHKLTGRVRSGHGFRGSGRVWKFGPACNSGPTQMKLLESDDKKLGNVLREEGVHFIGLRRH